MQGKRVIDTSGDMVRDFFVSKGWTKEQASGIAGNVQQESGFASNAFNSNAKETSYGLFQFNSKGNPAAYQQFKEMFDKPLTQATAQEQMEFVNWQLHNTEKSAGDALRKTDNAYDAGMVFGAKFERPQTVESSRGKNALEILQGKVGGIFKGVTVAGQVANVFKAITFQTTSPEQKTLSTMMDEKIASPITGYWESGLLIVGGISLIVAGGFLLGKGKIGIKL